MEMEQPARHSGVIGFCRGISHSRHIQFKTNGDVRWLIDGIIILASWPYAYFVMMPVSIWLFVIPPGTAVSPLRKSMQDWGLLEWGHVLIGFAAACVFAGALELPFD